VKLPLALVLAALAVGCATTDPADAQVAQGRPVTGSNIPGRVTRPSANSEGREDQIRRAEALHED
jgi:hypothetical protein